MIKSFTLIELIIVMAIMLILVAIGAPIYGNLQVKSQLNENASQLVQNLRIIKVRSIAGLNNSAHGVYFEINPETNDQYILYQGSSYASRDSSYDLVITLDQVLTITTSLTGQEVNFSQGLGVPDNTGEIILSHDTSGNKVISINALGLIQEQPSE